MLARPIAVPMGAEWVNAIPTLGFTPPPGTPVRFVVHKLNTQAVEWLYAYITAGHLGTGTDTNKATRRFARGLGLPTDDAGHIVGRSQGGPGHQNWNIFPQHSNLNRGAYAANIERTLNMMAQNTGGVHVWWNFRFENLSQPTRPTSFRYMVQSLNNEVIGSDLINNL
jgi:hypothetical protein